MKAQLEELAKEMIEEIKNLKDLTKENLPEVAKEYVRFNIILSLIGFTSSGFVVLVGLVMFVYGLSQEGYTNNSPDSATAYFAFGGLVALIGIIVGLINFVNYLGFKLQPRSKAIKGITSVFKL